MVLRAVITADIVNSTRLSRSEVRKIIKHIETVFDGHLIEFFRGDSFQVYLKVPAPALQMILLARTGTIKISGGVSDIKASIGIDLVKLPLKQLSTASGNAFLISGRSFDRMSNEMKLTIASNEKNEIVNTGLRLLSRFVDYLFRHMTAKQAAAVFELLMNKTQVEAAKKLKKSQATIHKHIQSAGWPEMEKLLTEYTILIKSINT